MRHIDCISEATLRLAVVSHHGTKLHQGHYTASMRLPTMEWCKLDDDNVSAVDIKDVLQEQQVLVPNCMAVCAHACIADVH